MRDRIAYKPEPAPSPFGWTPPRDLDREHREMRRQWLGPLRLDAGRDPAPQPRRLDQFGDDNPRWRLPGQRRVWEQREAGAARTGEFGQRTALSAGLLAVVPHADVRQQPGQQRDVYLPGQASRDGGAVRAVLCAVPGRGRRWLVGPART